MSGVVSGVVGGLIATVLTAYIARRVGKGGRPGELRFGGFMWGLAVACLAFSLLPVIATVFFGDDTALWAKAGVFLGFGAAAVYCFGEVAFVRGRFDEDGIRFHTPWTGTKQEHWEDLVSVELNGWCSWYTLTFASGKIVHLSTHLTGHVSALDAAASPTTRGNLPLRCPCCGYRTLRERGEFDICGVCYWEDDGQDDHDADDVRGGPNGDLSLAQARRNYREFGASCRRHLPHVRPPHAGEF